jgi:ADP-heptose:LPS heptosyltransferase
MSRILIYRLGSLGDTVVALPALHLVRRVFPHAQLSLLTNKPVASKAAAMESVLGSDFFAEVMDYPVGTRNPAKLLAVAKRIRAGNFDALVNLAAARGRLKALRDRMFFRLCGVRNTFGFPRERGDFEVSLRPDGQLYEAESFRLLKRLRALGEPSLDDPSSWELNLKQEELQKAEALIRSPSQPVLVACFGTKAQANDWEEEHWTKLLEKLRSRLPAWRLFTIGSADEGALAARCSASWGEAFTNMCGQLAPRESAGLLQRAKLFLGHDSGPMHLAAAVGTPCVAIFSARNPPGQWFPFGFGHKCLYHKTECFGCGLTTCIVEKKRCILSITVDEVFDAVMESLRSRGLTE